MNNTVRKILKAQIKLIFLLPESSIRLKIFDVRYSKIMVGTTIKLIKTIEIYDTDGNTKTEESIPPNRFQANDDAQMKTAGIPKLNNTLNGDFQKDLLINSKLALMVIYFQQLSDQCLLLDAIIV
jgi:hypothetical protein